MEPKYITRSGRYQKVFVSSQKLNHFVPESGSEIFVKNIPFESTMEEFVEFCEKAGPIYKLRLMMQDDCVHNRGYGFVTYMNPSMADRALAFLKKTKFQRVYLLVEKSFDNCRIFLGGIPTDKTKDELWMELAKQRISNIVDVIMYRSYSDRMVNRGFVFVEFQTHEQAAAFRARYRAKSLVLWGHVIIVDWSVPIPNTPAEKLKHVKRLFLRNLNVCQTPEELRHILVHFVNPEKLEKVFKFKNFAFIHLTTKKDAIYLMEKLKDYYKNTPVEVDWARPPDKYTTSEYRNNRISSQGRHPASRNNRFLPNSRPSTSSSFDISNDYSSVSGLPRREDQNSGSLMDQVNQFFSNFSNSTQDFLWVNQFANMTIQDWSLCLSNNATGEFIDLYQFIGDIFW